MRESARSPKLSALFTTLNAEDWGKDRSPK
jgi:hypothetical protein